MGWRPVSGDQPQQEEQRRGWRPVRVDPVTALGRNLADEFTFTWGDDIAGAVAGAAGAIRRGEWSPLTGVAPAIQSGGFQRDFERQQQQSQANVRQAQEDQPLASGIGQLGGALASTLIPGAAIGRVQRGMSLAGRLGTAGATGVGFGALSGAGSGNTVEERAQGALEGGAWGGLFGLGSHAVLGEIAPAVWRAGRRALNLPASSGRLGFAEQALDDVREVTRSNPNLSRDWRQAMANAANDTDRATIERMGPLGYAVSRAAQTDPSRTVAEVLGRGGQDRLAYLGRASGETGQRIEDLMLARGRNQAPELENAFLGRAQGTAAEMEETLRQTWRRRGRELYNPLLGTPPDRQALRAFVNLRRSPVFEHRAVQEAWRQADGLIQDDIANGLIPANATQNLRYRLHYAKVALDEMIQDPTRITPGLRNMSNASMIEARNNLVAQMENVIPGYAVVRDEMASIASAQRALQAGQNAFNRARFRRSEDLQRYVSSLSPEDRVMFMVGQEEAISQRIMSGGRDGRRNVANSLLDDTFQERLRIIHGPDADRMIETARNVGQRFEFGQRVRPSTGSITSNVLLQTGAGAAGGAALNENDPLAGAVQGAAVGFATGRLAPWAYQRALGPAAERSRNLLGRFYLTPVGEFSGARGGLLSRAQREASRREYRRRLAQTRAALYAGAGSAGFYSPEDEQ